MARITVEDCLGSVENRFKLVILAAKRAHQLEHGAQARVVWDNDKPTVVALREIAEGKTNYQNVDQSDDTSVTEITSMADDKSGDESEAL